MAQIVGRDDELRAIEAFVAGAPAAPAALVLEGEPGIGKSTLWRHGVELAAERGRRTLIARPAEAERAHAHAALGDLLEDVLDEVEPQLPLPRRHALRVALLLEDREDVAQPPRAVGVATRSAIEALAQTEPLVIAVDDEQWLDASSAAALSFALRRVEAPVLLLLSRRARAAASLEGAVPPERTERVRVGALSLGAIHQLLHDRLGESFSRRALRRLHETSGGNPFYALELARALADAPDPTQPLPVPERLEELVGARLDGFTGTTREALALASAHARLTAEELAAAGIVRSALDPALRQRVIEVTGGAVAFTHPLLASVLYQRLPGDERRGVHAQLARVVVDPLARARHLALSAEREDANVATALEEAAAVANAKGAPIAAAELGEHALRLTPPGDPGRRRRRAAAAARAHLAAGEVQRARLLARSLVDDEASSADRADALVLEAALAGGDLAEVTTMLRAALREPGLSPALSVRVHQQLGLVLRFREGHAVAEEHARAAVAVAERLGDPALEAAALGGLAIVRFNRGDPDARRVAERAYELARPGSDSRDAIEFALAHVLVWSLDIGAAREVLEATRRAWGDRDERVTANVLWYTALLEVRAGRLTFAYECAEEARDLIRQYSSGEDETPQTLLPLLLAAAHRGDLERARELSELTYRLAERHGVVLPTHAGPGLVHLWSGDAAAAVADFDAAERSAAATGFGEPAMYWWRGEYAEALLALRRVDDAVAILGPWENDARRLGRGWIAAHAVRSRGLVAAARGDVEHAEALLAEAAAAHEAAGEPFSRARALLALGIVRRRARQKRPAREAIEQAVAMFAELGAEGWAERARNELGAIGGRTRSLELTPAERRVAELVAQGRTNGEVAAALFLAERTVESHLSHVYAKLGVRSRTELARRL